MRIFILAVILSIFSSPLYAKNPALRFTGREAPKEIREWAWRAQFQSAILDDPRTASYVARLLQDPIGARNQEASNRFWEKAGDLGRELAGGNLLGDLAKIAITGSTEEKREVSRRNALAVILANPGEFESMSTKVHALLATNRSQLGSNDKILRKALDEMVNDGKFLSPAAATDALLSKVPDGSGFVKAAELLASATDEQFEEIRSDLSGIKNLLSSEMLGKFEQQGDLLEFMSQELKEQRHARERVHIISNYQAGVSLLAVLVSIKDPEAARFISEAGNATLGAAASLLNIREYGPDLVSVNGLAASLITLSGILGGQPDPDAERHKQVMQALSDIRGQLQEIREHLGQIDMRLEVMQSSLDDLTDLTTASYHSLSAQLSMIRGDQFEWARLELDAELAQLSTGLSSAERDCHIVLRDRPNPVPNYDSPAGQRVSDCLQHADMFIGEAASPKIILDGVGISNATIADAVGRIGWRSAIREGQLAGLLPAVVKEFSPKQPQNTPWPKMVHPDFWLRAVRVYLGTLYTVKEYVPSNGTTIKADLARFRKLGRDILTRLDATDLVGIVEMTGKQYADLGRDNVKERLTQIMPLVNEIKPKNAALIPLSAFVLPLNGETQSSWLKDRLAALICSWDDPKYCADGGSAVTDSDLFHLRLAIGGVSTEYTPLQSQLNVQAFPNGGGCETSVVAPIIRIAIDRERPPREFHFCYDRYELRASACVAARMTYKSQMTGRVLGHEDRTYCERNEPIVKYTQVRKNDPAPQYHSDYDSDYARITQNQRNAWSKQIAEDSLEWVKSRDAERLARTTVSETGENEVLDWVRGVRFTVERSMKDVLFQASRPSLDAQMTSIVVAATAKLGPCLLKKGPTQKLLLSLLTAEKQKNEARMDLGRMPSVDNIRRLLLSSRGIDEVALNAARFDEALPPSDLLLEAVSDMRENEDYSSCRNYALRFRDGLAELDQIESLFPEL